MLGRDHGSRPLRDVLSYAIWYARSGHQLLPTAVATVARVERLFREHWPTSSARWLPHGRLPQPWHLVANPAHASVLERLVAEAEAAGAAREAQYDGARRAWREGFVAEAVEAFSRLPFRDSSGADHAGVLTAADLAGWRASYEPAVVQRFRDVEVAKTDLWGQGPVLLQALAMLDGLPDEALDPSSADGVHLVTEVLKLALADREAWYGDASPVTAAQLLDPAYVEARLALVGDRASAELRPGSPGGHQPVLPATLLGGRAPARERSWASRPSRGTGRPRATPATSTWSTGGATSSRRRRAAAGCRAHPPCPSSGFCLGSRLQMCWLDEGLPVDADAWPAAADHALPHAGAARRPPGAGVRHPRRRPAGPVAAALPPASPRRRPRICRRRSTRRRSTPPRCRARSTRAR